MGMTDINNAAAAQNALTARINAFLDDIDADIATRQAAYAALAANLKGVVNSQMAFSATIDPDEPNPTNVDAGTFNTLNAAIAAAPAGSQVFADLVRDKTHIIAGANIPIDGRSVRVRSVGAGANAILKQEAYVSGTNNFMRGFFRFAGGSLWIENVVIEEGDKADAGLGWHAGYHSLCFDEGPDLTHIGLRASRVEGSDGYAVANTSYGSIVDIATYQSTLDGVVHLVNVANGGVTTLSNSALTLLNGATLRDAGASAGRHSGA